MMRSLRTRVLVGAAATSIAALCILGIAIDTAVGRTLLSEFDETLRAKANALASMVEYHNEKMVFEFNSDQMPEFNAGRHPQYFEIWLGGKLLASSPSLGSSHLPELANFDGATHYDMTLPDGRPGRLLAQKATPHIDPDENAGEKARSFNNALTLVVARDTHDLDHLNAHLRWTIFSLCAGAILLSSGALLYIVGRGTRPVRRLADQIASLDESDLATSLESAYLPTELTPVVERLNSLLARLAGAFTRERAFTADVAHELRTPLAGLRATLEVCRSRPRNAAEYEAAVDKSLDLLGQMQSLVENILMLARAEGGQLTPRPILVDLVLLLEESWAPFADPAEEHALRVSWQLPPTLPVACDPGLLRLILTNLIDNSVSYTNTGGEISILATAAAGQVIVEITNTGSQLTAEEVSFVFERFWRKDPSRTQTQRHAGLGLSLCRRLIAVLGGTISVENPDGNFVVRILLDAGNAAALQGITHKSGELSAVD